MPVPKRARYAVAGLLAAVPLVFMSATAWADEPIIIDFVRHGQSLANAAGTIDTVPPGTGLTDTGYQQAASVAELLQHEAPFAGVYASDELRALDTAEALTNTVQQLPGLDEIDAGIFEGQPVDSLGGVPYLLAPIAWTLGAEFVPIPGSPDVNGVAFDERFSDAVQAIYENTAGAGANTPTDVAFSSEGAMATWTLMNVNNPDFAIPLAELLSTGQLIPNTGQVVVSGDPQDGWTLVSFDGQPVPQDPGLPTELFVDARNLVEAPQFATYNIYEALLNGDPANVISAIDGGLGQVLSATEQFPVAVIGDITNALTTDLSGAAANLALAAF